MDRGLKAWACVVFSCAVVLGCQAKTTGNSDDNGDGDGAASGEILPDQNTVDLGGDVVVPVADCDVPPLVDVSAANTTIGDGTAGSCTEAALDAALAVGGVIAFDCGPLPHTITLTSEKLIESNTVLDGEGRITLDGGGTTRLFGIRHAWTAREPHLVLQRLALTGGHVVDDSGAAIFLEGGALTIVESVLEDHVAESVTQATNGGAIRVRSLGATSIINSRVARSSATWGGALYVMTTPLRIAGSQLHDNEAPSYSGDPMSGQGGALYAFGDGDISICGSNFEGNTASSHGGAIFVLGQTDGATFAMTTTTIQNNEVLPGPGPGSGGGLYLQLVSVVIEASTIANNVATGAGGFTIGPDATLAMTNTTIAYNQARTGTGGGIFLGERVTGSMTNCTFADNTALGEVSFGGATRGGESVVLSNSVFSGHEVGNAWEAITCAGAFIDGGGNIQYPVARLAGGSDDPDALCTATSLVADPKLGPLRDNGGPTATMMPAATSPAVGYGTACPPTDQRGSPRGSGCTAGAVEVTP